MSYQDMLDKRARVLHDAECSDRRCTPDTMGKWYNTARSEAILRDGKALDEIQELMSGKEWDSDTTSAVAQILIGTGRSILDCNDPDVIE